MAHFDWWRGHKEIKLVGLPLPTRGQFVRELRTRYGVQAKVVANCTVDESLMEYADSYNQVVIDRLTERYGRDVISDLDNELESQAAGAQE